MVESVKKEIGLNIENVVQRYGHDMRNTAIRYMKNEHDADDVFQEVCLKLFRNLHCFQGESSLRTWIIRITINTAKDFLRKEKELTQYTMEESAVQGMEIYHEPHREHKNELLEEAMNQLPMHYKNVVICVYFMELTMNETAFRLGLTESMVKNRLIRAKRKLRDFFKEKKI